MLEINKIYNGDCLQLMEDIPDGSVDMVFTSPPYADRRKKCYGGVKADKYVAWFTSFVMEIKRILKSTGSFFLNIKPHTVKGERDLYVMKLVIALREQVGFKYIDELCWTKNAFPGAHKGRLKNGFEPVYHFTKSMPSEITFNPTACGTPMKAESIARTYRKQCGAPANNSGMTGMNTTNIRHLKLARPSNVIHVNNVSNQFTDKQKHPATFPEGMVEFFIKTYTNKGDTILDPFIGSGTTAVAAINTNRNFIGIEKEKKYVDIANQRIKNAEPELF